MKRVTIRGGFRSRRTVMVRRRAPGYDMEVFCRVVMDLSSVLARVAVRYRHDPDDAPMEFVTQMIRLGRWRDYDPVRGTVPAFVTNWFRSWCWRTAVIRDRKYRSRGPSISLSAPAEEGGVTVDSPLEDDLAGYRGVSGRIARHEAARIVLGVADRVLCGEEHAAMMAFVRSGRRRPIAGSIAARAVERVSANICR